MFWFRYLTVLVIGTAVVWFLAPSAGEVIRGRLVDAADAGAETAEFRDWDCDASGGADGVLDDSGALPEGFAEVSDEDGGPGFFSTARSVSREESSPQPGEEAPADEHHPMSLERVWQSSDDVALWGVVARNSAAYRKDGKKLPAKAPGGTLVEITKTTFTDKGEQMALCALWDARRRRWAGPVLVPAANIAMFDGTRDGIYDEDVERLVGFCRINAALIARKEALDRMQVDMNPHAAPLREIDAENKRLAAMTKDLTAKRDRLTGAARNRVADELRSMEAQATELSMAAKRELALYEEWKKAHPFEKIDYMRDPEYRDLHSKLRAAKPGVAMFGLAEALCGGDVE